MKTRCLNTKNYDFLFRRVDGAGIGTAKFPGPQCR